MVARIYCSLNYCNIVRAGVEQIPMNSEIKIDKGIAPPANFHAGSRHKYPWKAMGVGDSFLAENVPKSFPVMVGTAGRLNGVKFSYQRLSPTSFRVWRIA